MSRKYNGCMGNKPKITWDAVVVLVVVVEEERKWVVQCRWTSWMPPAFLHLAWVVWHHG